MLEMENFAIMISNLPVALYSSDVNHLKRKPHQISLDPFSLSLSKFLTPLCIHRNLEYLSVSRQFCMLSKQVPSRLATTDQMQFI